MRLILCSSSPARKELLSRLQVPFETTAPNIDETAHPQENIEQTVARLSASKAQTCQQTHPDSLIIGCDQLVALKNHILGKPHTHARAVEQLRLCSNKILHSYTALSVLNTHTKMITTKVITYQVKFKPLDDITIENYLLADTPYQCAGSIQAESLGIVLFEWMRGDDPTALTGLPLIALTQMLASQNFKILAR